MKKLLLLATLVLAAACGDDSPTLAPDGAQPMPDGPNPQANFTSYVIDLVTNQTADDTAPRAYDEFSALPDPDEDNAAAYSSLF